MRITTIGGHSYSGASGTGALLGSKITRLRTLFRRYIAASRMLETLKSSEDRT